MYSLSLFFFSLFMFPFFDCLCPAAPGAPPPRTALLRNVGFFVAPWGTGQPPLLDRPVGGRPTPGAVLAGPGRGRAGLGVAGVAHHLHGLSAGTSS